MRNSAGAVLGDLPLGTPLADGTPALTMKRSRFAVRLVDEARRRGIRIDHGRQLIGAERQGDAVRRDVSRTARPRWRISSSERTASIRSFAGSSIRRHRRAAMWG